MRLTEEEKREREDIIQARLHSGWTYAEIGEYIGITKQRTHQIAKGMGLIPTFQELKDEARRRDLSEYIKQGLSAMQIATIEETNPSSIRQQVKRLGLSFPKRVAEHGTTGRYKTCKCDKCKAANTAYYREYRERRKQKQA